MTALRVEWGAGHGSALDRLVPRVERELRTLAHCYMRGAGPDQRLAICEGVASSGDARWLIANCDKSNKSSTWHCHWIATSARAIWIRRAATTGSCARKLSRWFQPMRVGVTRWKKAR